MGLSFLPSQANFVFFDCRISAELIYQELLKEGVVLCPLTDSQLPTHFRMSVGLVHENEAAIAALKKVLAFGTPEASPTPSLGSVTPTYGPGHLNFEDLQ